MTIKDVAHVAGVNVSTASRALSGSYGVHPATREKVVRAAQELSYQPNPSARGLVTGRTRTIGLLISDIRNPFFAEVARGVEDAAAEAGVQVFLCNSDMDPGKQMRHFHALRARQVDGVIMNTVSNLNPAQRQELRDGDVRVVLLNPPPDAHAGFSVVSCDNFQGGFLAGQHLIALGHKQVAHITGPRGHGNFTLRASGFLKAFDLARGSAVPVVLRGEHSFSGGIDLTKKLLLRHPDVTALFAANDVMAFGALHALAAMGRSAPADLSIIGFDDVEMASVVTPTLTTIHQPKRELGVAAVQILLRETDAPERRIFDVALVERESCRARQKLAATAGLNSVAPSSR